MAKATKGRPGVIPKRLRHIAFRDRRLPSVVLNPDKDHRPWAAYTLGHESRMLPYYVSLFPIARNMGRCVFDGVPVAADRVRLAIDILSDVIPPGVLGMMSDAWRSIVRRVGLLEAEFVASGTVPDRNRALADLVARLSLLTSRAVSQGLPITRWFEVGCAVGEFYQQDQLHDGTDGVPFRPVIEAVRCFAVSEQHDCPELQQVVALLDHSEAATEEVLRNLYVDRTEPDWPHPEESPWPNSPFFGHKVRRLHLAIDEYLLDRPVVQLGRLCPFPDSEEALGRADITGNRTTPGMARPHASDLLVGGTLPVPPLTPPGSSPQHSSVPQPQHEAKIKPKWDKKTGQLCFGEHLAAVFQDRGDCLCAILDKFQESNWEPIDDPHPRAIFTKGGHVRSLNEKVKFFRFRGSGSKRGIRWERR
jgi:hypothetical protein